jgi:uncharacterized membrane protein YdjX (TVP38/TMEM64 family)
MSKRTKILLAVFSLLPIIFLLVYGYLFPSSFFSNQEAIRDYILRFGIWAPIIFILLQITQVVLTPISHYAVGLAGGFIFGTWWGFFLNYIGRIIGHTIAFFLSRTIGRPIVEKLVKPKTLQRYDNFWQKGGSFLLFLIYYLPLFPDDEVSYIAGTSKIKIIPFLIANILGHIGGAMALAYIGSGIKFGTLDFIIVFFITGVLAVVFSIVWWKKYRPKSKIDISSK